MGRLTKPQGLAFVHEVAEAFQSASELFAEAGVDISDKVAETLASGKEAEVADGEQITAHSEAVAKSRTALEKRDFAVDKAERLIAFAESLLGKKHEFVHKLRLIAKRYSNSPRKDNSAPPPKQ